MRRILNISSILVLLITGLSSVTAAEKDRPRTVFISDTNTVTATVQDIDYDKREITLQGPNGLTEKFKVSDEAKNFSRIKKGDQVAAQYYQSMAISLAEPGEAASTAEQVVQRAGTGEKPGGVAMSTMTATATVKKIDRDKREVTLRKPDGTDILAKVDPSVGDLTRIKKGDNIKITYTEALAISVEPVGK